MRFVVVYQREPHARQLAFFDVPQPTTDTERVALAKQTLADLALDVDVWIDDLGDQSRAAFGDLPNAAIVIDPAGTVRLKLSWCDPTVLGLTLPEILATLPAERPAPAAAGFLEAIADTATAASDEPIARHHHQTMLAELAVRHPGHPDRGSWLAKLAASGPPRQRAWAARLLQPPERGER